MPLLGMRPEDKGKWRKFSWLMAKKKTKKEREKIQIVTGFIFACIVN
jgi:hypothetical protein